MRAIAAIWLRSNWRAREAATVTSRSPAAVVRDRRRRMLSSSRCGTRFCASLARPSTTRTRFSSRRPTRRSTIRKGLPWTSARVRRRSPPARCPQYIRRHLRDRRSSQRGQAVSSRPRRWSVRPALGGSAVLPGSAGPRSATRFGGDASHWVSMRKAKPHPGSAHCTSSRHTSSGCRSAARSSRVCTSWKSQNGSSRERSRESGAVRSISIRRHRIAPP